MLTLQLPEAIEKRLGKLARRTGRGKGFHACEAILRYLEDSEDLNFAEKASKRIRTGKDKAIPLEIVLKRNGKER